MHVIAGYSVFNLESLREVLLYLAVYIVSNSVVVIVKFYTNVIH